MGVAKAGRGGALLQQQGAFLSGTDLFPMERRLRWGWFLGTALLFNPLTPHPQLSALQVKRSGDWNDEGWGEGWGHSQPTAIGQAINPLL